MTRRRFTFWLGFGLFSLADRFRLDGLDSLAALAMGGGESTGAKSQVGALPEHWAYAEDDAWQWFERENYIDGRWVLTGCTTPVHKKTGERKSDSEAYLEDDFLPPELRTSDSPATSEVGVDDVLRVDDAADEVNQLPVPDETGDPDEAVPSSQLPAAMRRARHGRPPSKWLRRLNAAEIRIWLKTIEVPEAGVSGMTYWEHLTRDHAFDPIRIEGLEVSEQAKLHAAAHFGY